jgi:outer membrane receptor protein involved in Fe transport
MFMDNRSQSQIAPSGAFFVTNSIPCGNPLLSDQQFEQLCGQFGLTEEDTQIAYLGRRNIEGGPRGDDLRHTTFRIVAGARGDINDTWRYDAYLQYSEVSMERTYMNDLSTTRIIRALDAVEDDNGDIVCRSVVDGSDPNCVPWDIFTTGAVSGPEGEAMQNYLKIPLFARGTTDQTVYSAYVAGDLGNYGVKLPSAESGINVVLGAEYRDEGFDYNPDQGFLSGDGAGQGGATLAVTGGYDVTEFFTEVSIPLVEGAAFAEELTLDMGYRYSDYSTDHETDTYGFRAGWAINQQFKLRASYQRAVRAANIRELFLPQGLNLFAMGSDPCAGPTPGRSASDCARSGVTPGQYGSVPDNPAGQYNFLQGGNPELEPEEADTYTAGIIWTPDFADGLSISVDYYDIEIEKGIDKLGPEFTLNQCLDGNDAQCAKVNRGNAGDLWIGSNYPVSGHIEALNDNLAIERVKGWDILVDYDIEIGKWGSLSFHNNMAIIDTWDQQELEGAPTVDCNGNWGATCGYPTVDFQNNLRTTWITPWNLTASLMWRHIGEVDDINVGGDGVVGSNGLDLDATDYFDLAGIWEVTDWASLRAGVNNMFDEEPPIAGNLASAEIQGNGNIFPGMYDALGRYWYFGVEVGF